LNGFLNIGHVQGKGGDDYIVWRIEILGEVYLLSSFVDTAYVADSAQGEILLQNGDHAGGRLHSGDLEDLP
jgi:hypothetical protein